MPPGSNIHYVKFLRGTIAAYENLKTNDRLDNDTLYFVYTSSEATKGLLYLGDKLISGSTSEGTPTEISIADIKDVVIDGDTLANKQILAYNNNTGKWENTDLADIISTAISVMEGATSLTNGKSGLVPQPNAGDENKFLKGDGTWATVNIPKFDGNIFEESITGTLTLRGSSSATTGFIPVMNDEGKLSWMSASIGSLERQIVSSVDDIDLTDTNTIYLIQKPVGQLEDGNKYDEYMVISGEVEKIGSLGGSQDLSNYATISFVNSEIKTLSDILNDTETIDENTGDTIVQPGVISRLTNLETNIGDLSNYSSSNTLVDRIEKINERLVWGDID